MVSPYLKEGSSCEASSQNSYYFNCQNAIDGFYYGDGYMAAAGTSNTWIRITLARRYTLTYIQIVNAINIKMTSKEIQLDFDQNQTMNVCNRITK